MCCVHSPPASQLIPPFNFGWVEEDLYRCGHPNELNFPFLEKLNLKACAARRRAPPRTTLTLCALQVIIYLASETPSQQIMNFIDDQEASYCVHHAREFVYCV